MTTPATPGSPVVAAFLTCSVCGHAHSEAEWAYQSGYCHACGQPLAIPTTPAALTALYSTWLAGPHPRAGIILEREQAVAKLIAEQVAQDPPTTPPVMPPPGSFATFAQPPVTPPAPPPSTP